MSATMILFRLSCIRSVVALEKDLSTLDKEFTKLSDCLAKGEQDEFNSTSPASVKQSNAVCHTVL